LYWCRVLHASVLSAVARAVNPARGNLFIAATPPLSCFLFCSGAATLRLGLFQVRYRRAAAKQKGRIKLKVDGL
jgi:hypothetical protein